jgi:tRNA-Thr(GGU) m(6)t(6)A37 methyltransferase TsaA
MDNSMAEIAVRPIGKVRNEVKQHRRGGWEEVASEIVIDENFTEYLDGLEQFSHIIVVYWMHRVAPVSEPLAKVHPRGREDLPLVGIFSTRAPYRPNPLGVTTTRLMQRKGNVLKVAGLDALDGTPVIDIKPYMPHYDSPPDATEADWVKKLR